jgi:hypothetical protein
VIIIAYSTYSQQYDDEKDFEYEIVGRGGVSVEITGYKGSKTIVRIPSQIENRPVVTIVDESFTSMGITNVSIPDTVTSIGHYAFAGNQLTNIVFPNSVQIIGEGTFASNPLTRITIPKGLGAMYDRSNKYANPFSINPLLEYISVDLDNRSFTSKNGILFSKDEKVFIAYPSAKGTSYIIPVGVTYIANRAFAGTQINNINIPNGVLTIGEGAFMRANLSSVILPSTLREIGSHAFFENQLTSINIPYGIRQIGEWTFYGNNFSSVTIPETVVLIGNNAFTGNQLTSITIGSNISLADEYSVAFDNDFDVFYNRNGKRAGTYTYARGRWNRR